MAFTYGSSHQDEIALLLAKKEYSELSTAQKKMIDNGSSGSPGGAVGRAIDLVERYAALMNVGAPDEIPDEWGRWVILEAASDAAQAFSSAEDEDLTQKARNAQIRAFQSFTITDADDDVSGATPSLTVAGIRQYVMARCVSGTEVVIPQISVIDTCLQTILSDLWNMADWPFRAKEVEITLATNGTVTLDPSVTVDKVISSELYYTGGEQGKCVLADRDLIQQDLSDDELDTGKPEYFRTTRAGNTVSWLFNRTADQEYTMLGTVTVQLGATSDTTTMNTALGLLPAEFLTIVRDQVFGMVMQDMGSRRSGVIVERARQRLDNLAYSFATTENEDGQRDHTPMRRRTLGGPSRADIGGFM